MTRRTTMMLFLAVTAVLMVAGVVLSVGREPVFDTALYGLLLPGVLAVSGVLVVGRQPQNPIGWLFCGFALFTSLAELAEGYGHSAAERGWSGGVFGEWVITWSWLLETALWLLIFLIFPTGRLAGRRWRIVLWIGIAGIALALPAAALDSTNGAAFDSGENPFAVESDAVQLLLPVGLTLTTFALLAAVGSLVLRLRRARGVERQQLKWFVAAAALMGAVSPFAVIFWYRSSLVQLPMALAISAVPVACTIAILRYRLYDIDVVINRTLVYGALTATLAASYLVGVLLLQFALGPLTQRSELAVAGSTLAVAGLFRPARTRIQGVVDRRFYRSRYDAARTLEAIQRSIAGTDRHRSVGRRPAGRRPRDGGAGERDVVAAGGSMIRHATAWFLLAVAVLMAAGAVLSFGRETLVDTLTFGLLLPGALAGSGFLVVRRHPANPIGWLFCGYALWGALAELGQAYGYLAAERGLPAGEVGEWIRSWSWVVDQTFLLAILLLFPTGRFFSRRWRFVLWIGFLGCLTALPGLALNPDLGVAFSSGVNPFAVDSPLVDVLFVVGTAVILLALVAAVACLAIRLHRAEGIERQQLKWFALAAAFLVAVSPFAALFWYDSFLVQVIVSLAISAVPIAATVAILRYRLYDIDIVIIRTLVYTALTATLAATYLVSVLLLQFVLNPLTPQSELAVAGSTLAVAALFRPARARIQTFVDRRFYRSRYDARRTLESFSGRLREQLDVEALRADLSAVVRETLQPEHVSLWMPNVQART